MTDLEHNKPTYILDTAPAGIYRWNRYPIQDYRRLWSFVQQGYELVDNVDDVHVYRRRSCELGV